MSAVIEYQLNLYSAIGLGVGGIIFMILRLIFAKRPGGWEFLWVLALLFACLLGAIAWWQSTEPGLYTRTTGSPIATTVTGLTYLNGPLGQTSRLRVDTDHGVFFLDASAPIPKTGTVYLITRERKWGTSTRTFLCLHAAGTHCWAVQIDEGS
ncbi:MAG TPA: hypothetical protein VNI53_04965 [Gammaproteobacteria bacterium]|nr:hypothetical protein [Gammaproteobacteria bacterium]